MFFWLFLKQNGVSDCLVYLLPSACFVTHVAIRPFDYRDIGGGPIVFSWPKIRLLFFDQMPRIGAYPHTITSPLDTPDQPDTQIIQLASPVLARYVCVVLMGKNHRQFPTSGFYNCVQSTVVVGVQTDVTLIPSSLTPIFSTTSPAVTDFELIERYTTETAPQHCDAQKWIIQRPQEKADTLVSNFMQQLAAKNSRIPNDTLLTLCDAALALTANSETVLRILRSASNERVDVDNSNVCVDLTKFDGAKVISSTLTIAPKQTI
eukprot:c8513_g1_i1.p1 GENE.c8513_g1_i1~~c8513_g1_i1.p1  ORF type:complete len:263 (-),score=67.98 c8513_g1_i1:60-848(-)